MMPTENELKGFLEVCRFRSISRAAQSLLVSQPSLSQSLVSLEKKVGVRLFVRKVTGTGLTREGSAFIEHARELLSVWERARSQAVLQSDDLRGTVRLGCHESVALYALSPVVGVTQERFPLVSLALVHDLSRRVTDMVLHRELDLALAINPLRAPDLVVRSLGQDEFTLFLPPGEQAGSSSGNPHPARVAVVPAMKQTQVLLEKASRIGVNFEALLESTSLEVCAALLAHGRCAACLPARIASLLAPGARPIPGVPVYEDRICLVYRRDAWGTAGGRRYLRAVEDALRAAFST